MIETNTLPAGPPETAAGWLGPAATARDDDEFVRRAAPFRRELLVHCYRMLGSLHDAEDLVQETYLRAWRGYDRFEGRSTLRQWLYRIATSACLTALEHHSRRILPAGIGAPSTEPERPLLTAAIGEAVWVQPLPDTLADDPAAIVASRESVRLAFIAALQHLPARQRAVLILRDVLAWHAAEVAELLDTTTIAVNSALRRARMQLAKAAPLRDELTEPEDPRRRALLDRYTTAFENADLPELLRLLRDDVVLEMPPHLTWFSGRAQVTRFLAAQVLGSGGRRFVLVPTGANGQPAVAGYILGVDGLWHAHALQVLTMRASGISRIVSFNDPALFPGFALPAVLPGPVLEPTPPSADQIPLSSGCLSTLP
jgi:RNA polymerase sigma-70 factor (ECF subfamily)